MTLEKFSFHSCKIIKFNTHEKVILFNFCLDVAFAVVDGNFFFLSFFLHGGDVHCSVKEIKNKAKICMSKIYFKGRKMRMNGHIM